MKKLKENRVASFAVVTAVYIIATVVGILVYNALELDWWLSLLIADVAATVVTFIFSLIFGNASVYDPYWSVQPPVILIASICQSLAGRGDCRHFYPRTDQAGPQPVGRCHHHM